ncbi:MAG: hypothetical protein JXR37_09125 [Kiritimatiellae bacterium]|nr:hypothetical protein [Kiritimatiellia bacterium]
MTTAFAIWLALLFMLIGFTFGMYYGRLTTLRDSTMLRDATTHMRRCRHRLESVLSAYPAITTEIPMPPVFPPGNVPNIPRDIPPPPVRRPVPETPEDAEWDSPPPPLQVSCPRSPSGYCACAECEDRNEAWLRRTNKEIPHA